MLIGFEGRAVENDASLRKVERSYLIIEAGAYDPVSVLHQYQINAVQGGSKHLSNQEINQFAHFSDAFVALNPHIDVSSNPLEQIFSANDIHIDTVVFNQAVANFEAEQVFKIAAGSGSVHSPSAIIAASPFVEDEPISIAATVWNQPKGVTPEELMKMCCIDWGVADQTLKCTAQLKKQDTAVGISKRFSTNDQIL